MYKRIKKVSTILFIMVSMLTLFGPLAMASEIPDVEISQGLTKQIEQTNDFIYNEIDKAVNKAENEAHKNQSEQELSQAIDRIIEDLLGKTEKKVDKLIEKATKEGIELEKHYIEVQIHDRIIYVDPCYAH